MSQKILEVSGAKMIEELSSTTHPSKKPNLDDISTSESFHQSGRRGSVESLLSSTSSETNVERKRSVALKPTPHLDKKEKRRDTVELKTSLNVDNKEKRRKSVEKHPTIKAVGGSVEKKQRSSSLVEKVSKPFQKEKKRRNSVDIKLPPLKVSGKVEKRRSSNASVNVEEKDDDTLPNNSSKKLKLDPSLDKTEIKAKGAKQQKNTAKMISTTIKRKSKNIIKVVDNEISFKVSSIQ